MWVFYFEKCVKTVLILHHDVEICTFNINNNTKLLIFSDFSPENWFKMGTSNKLH